MNKKGFTLIELLAVIIILAIVALIATPIVLNVVEDAKKSAGESEANMVLNGIINYCETEKMGMGEKETICNNGITKEEVNQMVNLGKAEILEIEYGDKLTWLKIKSNGHIYGLENGKMVRDLEAKPTIKPNAPNLLGKLTPIKFVVPEQKEPKATPAGTITGYWKIPKSDEEWYNYDKKEWANAVVLNTTKNPGDVITEADIDLWYVWIPRYKYQIFNDGKNVPAGQVNSIADEQAINVVFEAGTATTGNIKCTDNIKGTGNTESETCVKINKPNETVKVGDWYTHPAFTFGGKELEGIWVGKFESSAHTSNAEKIAIKPNAISLTNKTVSQFHTMIRKMETDYSINGDTHMMKNMEWGAVAYLAHSNYGLCTNNVCVDIERNNYVNMDTFEFKTGYGAVHKATVGQNPDNPFVAIPGNEFGIKEDGEDAITKPYNTDVGIKASTTQNIYGIYDLSGGAAEYTMGNMVDGTGQFYATDYDGFTQEDGTILKPDEKYYDKYSFNENYLDFTRGKLGDATKETIKTVIPTEGEPDFGWTGDHAYFPEDRYPWFVRSGYSMHGSEAGLFVFRGDGGNAYPVYAARGVLVAR